MTKPKRKPVKRMPRREYREEQAALSMGSILLMFQPLISVVVMATGLVVWAFNTFAQLSYVEKQYNEIKAGQEQIKKEAFAYSDGNREKLLPAVIDLKEAVKEVKESVKSLESRLLIPINTGHK